MLQLLLNCILYVSSVVTLTALSYQANTDNFKKFKITENYTGRVFSIHNPFGGRGTGWLLRFEDTTLVVTAAHVCDIAPIMYTAEYGELPVILNDPKRDLCILTMLPGTKVNVKPLEMDTKFDFRMLIPIEAISRTNPEVEYTITGTTVMVGHVKTHVGLGIADYRSYMHTAPTIPGTSGGPIFGPSKKVICMTTMIWSTSSNHMHDGFLGECVPVSEIRASLEENFLHAKFRTKKS